MKVTVIGFWIEGEDMARYFVDHGAEVTVSTLRVVESRKAAQAELAARGVRFYIGSNEPAHVAGADLVCVSQGVPLTVPAVIAAREAGIPVRSMTSLFFERYPGPIVGITGSSGKTTTTSLVDAIFTAAGRDHVLGGNIGRGLLQLLDDASPSRPAVLEVSHTQLQLTERSPHVACLTNVTPNHLDKFSWEDYIALKRKIFEFQTPEDIAVFNADDPVSRELCPSARSRVLLFSLGGDHGADGAYLSNDAIYMRSGGAAQPAVAVGDIPLRGRHNVANVAAAAAVAVACDIAPEAVGRAVRAFKAPAHRLELVGTVRGVAYYNDSIATAPERTLAALHSFTEPIVLLLGGREKDLPLVEMLTQAKRVCRAVVCFGEAGPMFAEAAAALGLNVLRVPTVAEALDAASRLAQPGDVVLLSPAGTSFDAYDSFEQRGDEFRRLVQEMETQS